MMDGLTIKQATTWEEVEQYTGRVQSCIRPGTVHQRGANWEKAKQSWDDDFPRPVYLLIDYHKDAANWAGYIRLLSVGAFLYSDYYTIVATGKGPHMPSGAVQEVFVEIVKHVNSPVLVNHTSYGGREVKWIGPPLAYARVNLQPGGSLWLVFPDEVKVVPAPPTPAYTDYS